MGLKIEVKYIYMAIYLSFKSKTYVVILKYFFFVCG